MSIAYQCDRCGKLVAIAEEKQKIHMVIANFRDVYGNENRHYEDMTRMDICDECNESLTEWLSMMNDIMAEGDNNHGRDVRAGASKKGAGASRRKARKADGGDTPDEG